MKRILLLSAVFLLLVSCEQRYYYRNKFRNSHDVSSESVRVHSGEKIIKKDFSEITDSIPVNDFITTMNTLQPLIPAKPVKTSFFNNSVEQKEHKEIRNNHVNYRINPPQEKPFPFKLIIGLMLVMAGVYVIPLLKNGIRGGSQVSSFLGTGGCLSILIVLLPTVIGAGLVVTGIIEFIRQ